MVLRNTLGQDERLKREQHIETLFRKGKAFSVFPIRCIWLLQPRGDELFPVRVAISVPKKKFKKAVDRNRIKRLIREAYRLQKHDLYASISTDMQLHLFLIYQDRIIPTQELVMGTIAKALPQLQKVTAIPTGHA